MGEFNLFKRDAKETEAEPNVPEMEAKKDVDGLIRALTYNDKLIRRAAAWSLRRIGDARAVEPLTQSLLGDEDPDVRRASATVLGQLKDTRAVKPLIQALSYRDVLEKAEMTLRTIGQPAVEPLVQALKDKHGYVRREAARILNYWLDWKPRDNAETVAYLLAERNSDELARLGKQAVELLIEALNHEDQDVRGDAAETLGKIKDPRAIEPLIKALEDDYCEVGYHEVTGEHFRYYPVRLDAMEALGKIGQPALEPLIKTLNHQDRDVRVIVVEALGMIGGARAVKALTRALEDKDVGIRETANFYLAKLDNFGLQNKYRH